MQKPEETSSPRKKRPKDGSSNTFFNPADSQLMTGDSKLKPWLPSAHTCSFRYYTETLPVKERKYPTPEATKNELDRIRAEAQQEMNEQLILAAHAKEFNYISQTQLDYYTSLLKKQVDFVEQALQKAEIDFLNRIEEIIKIALADFPLEQTALEKLSPW